MFYLPTPSAFPVFIPHCNDDLAAAHYRLAHAVTMVGLQSTSAPNHISYWDYNRLKARSGSCPGLLQPLATGLSLSAAVIASSLMAEDAVVWLVAVPQVLRKASYACLYNFSFLLKWTSVSISSMSCSVSTPYLNLFLPLKHIKETEMASGENQIFPKSFLRQNVSFSAKFHILYPIVSQVILEFVILISQYLDYICAHNTTSSHNNELKFGADTASEEQPSCQAPSLLHGDVVSTANSLQHLQNR